MLKFLGFASTYWFRIFISFAYTASFYFGYIYFLNFYFGYLGFDIIEARSSNWPLAIITFVFAVIPAVFYGGVKAISSFLCIFIYYILYVPIIVTYFFSLEGSTFYLLFQQILFAVSMSLLFLSDRVVFKKVLVIQTRGDLFKGLIYVTLITAVFVAFVYRNGLKLVSFEDVYVLREDNNRLGTGLVISYVSSWFLNVMIPICFGYSFFSKKRLYFIIGTLGCLIMYMATAAKIAVVYPLLSYLIYLVFVKFDFKYSFSLIGGLLSIFLVIMSIIDFNLLSSLIIMRTIGNGGDLTRHYHDFFLNHPHTYYSHINLLNKLTHTYPYKEELGFVVGSYYWNDKMNANANFWATDGYAAIGDWGVLLSTLMLCVVFIAFNTIAKHYNKVFVIVILLPYLTSFLNTSMFQSLLTGGAVLTFGFLSFSSIRNNKYIAAN